MPRLRRALPLALLLACAAEQHQTLPPSAQPHTAPQPTSTPAPISTDMVGFSPARAADQRNLEAKFDATVTADNLRVWMKALSARPHHVGSPQDRANVEMIAELFRSWGYQTEITEYKILYPTPKVRRIELLEPRRYRAALREPRIKQDPISRHHKEQLPPYHIYAIDGDVTAPLVYVNYGVQEDYERLERMGVDVSGKIAIARYGRAWRGIKPKLAAEHGAVGCIVYSDPKDDGYGQGDVYPDGPFRHAQGVQRGSVYDLPLRVGDPLTPFVGATEDAERLPLDKVETLTKIPVLPISWSDAQPLLESLAGEVAPPNWRGALPITYHVGPGPARVHLQLESNWDLVPAYNVIAKLPGAELPDEWVMRGNHHDAWVAGASDPISGLVALLEEARAVAELARAGHPPRRTVVYAAWGAEEPGIIGSTEWVEHNAELLRRNLAVYINSDSNGRGFLSVGGSHALARLVNEAAREVIDPQTQIPVLERQRARMLVSDRYPADDLFGDGDLPIQALGSGSDFTPFLQHLGVASLNLGFGGENRGGSYHSAFDSFEHYTRFGDPGFVYGVALAKVAGRVTLRIANADVLPLRFETLAATLEKYTDDIEQLTDDMRSEAEHTNRLLAVGAHVAAADPTRPYVAPKARGPVPHLALGPLRNALTRLRAAAESYDQNLADTLVSGDLSPTLVTQLDQLAMQTERALAPQEGLPGRPWYRHLIYAPGLYTGYGVKTLPGVREAVEGEDWPLADHQLLRIIASINAVAEKLETAAALLAKTSP